MRGLTLMPTLSLRTTCAHFHSSRLILSQVILDSDYAHRRKQIADVLGQECGPLALSHITPKTDACAVMTLRDAKGREVRVKYYLSPLRTPLIQAYYVEVRSEHKDTE